MNTNLYVRLFFVILCMLLGFLKKKSKAVFLFEVAMLSLFTGLYNGNIDLYYYRREYVNNFISASPFDKMYEYLAIISYKLGMSFSFFHFLITLISICVFAYVIKKWSKQPALCVSLLFGFTTFEYAFQLKAMTSSAVIILAIYIYFQNISSKKRQIIFTFLIFIATGFHFFAIIFLILLLIPYFELRMIKSIICLFAIIGSIFIPFIMKVLQNIIPDVVVYSRILSVKTFSLSVFWQIAGVIICNYLLHIRGIREKKYTLKMINNLIEPNGFLIYIGSILLLVSVPFYWFTNVMLRVPRVWFVLYSILASNCKGSLEGGAIYRIRIPNIFKEIFITYNLFSFIAFYILFTKADLLSSYLADNIFLNLLFGI
ncbi:MAG: EpsG family protein [Lachnospiraceae bacterium]|nr:EpsG family protein [Lachnospiraceae bacterium]